MTETREHTSVRAELESALAGVQLKPADLALVAMARMYADKLDEAEDRLREADEEGQAADFSRMVLAISRMGERLERALDRLGMTPAARDSAKGGDGDGGDGDPEEAALAALRGGSGGGGAAAGIDYSQVVDPAVTAADA